MNIRSIQLITLIGVSTLFMGGLESRLPEGFDHSLLAQILHKSATALLKEGPSYTSFKDDSAKIKPDIDVHLMLLWKSGLATKPLDFLIIPTGYSVVIAGNSPSFIDDLLKGLTDPISRSLKSTFLRTLSTIADAPDFAEGLCRAGKFIQTDPLKNDPLLKLKSLPEVPALFYHLLHAPIPEGDSAYARGFEYGTKTWNSIIECGSERVPLEALNTNIIKVLKTLASEDSTPESDNNYLKLCKVVAVYKGIHDSLKEFDLTQELTRIPKKHAAILAKTALELFRILLEVPYALSSQQPPVSNYVETILVQTKQSLGTLLIECGTELKKLS